MLTLRSWETSPPTFEGAKSDKPNISENGTMDETVRKENDILAKRKIDKHQDSLCRVSALSKPLVQKKKRRIYFRETLSLQRWTIELRSQWVFVGLERQLLLSWTQKRGWSGKSGLFVTSIGCKCRHNESSLFTVLRKHTAGGGRSDNIWGAAGTESSQIRRPGSVYSGHYYGLEYSLRQQNHQKDKRCKRHAYVCWLEPCRRWRKKKQHILQTTWKQRIDLREDYSNYLSTNVYGNVIKSMSKACLYLRSNVPGVQLVSSHENLVTIKPLRPEKYLWWFRLDHVSLIQLVTLARKF